MEQHSTPLLPVLSEAELRVIFQDDERAIWRYQLLSALLHERAAIREVAQRYSTTPETVRTLAATFLETGHLDVLRSKRRGAAGHLGRQTPLAQAVARVLATDPAASGSTVLRKVKEQLAGTNVRVPRRSVYRLVDRLRAHADVAQAHTPENDVWAPGLVPALRAALPLLPLEPPLDLGASQLAADLLPHESDQLQRGRALREALLQGLDTLRPEGDTNPQSPTNRPYTILIGEALRGQTREDLQRELAIAPATYTRAKRQGLEQLAEALVQGVQQYFYPARRGEPPAVPPLLRRDRELAYYAQRLMSEGIAVIWGIPGCGKTVLAATLAMQRQAQNESVIWHSCTDEGDALLRGVLASCGNGRPSQNLDTAGLLNAVREQLKRGGLLVLDAYERVVGDPAADLLIAAIRGLIGQYGVGLIVVSRELPAWAEQQDWLPLGGVTDEAARALWTIFGGRPLDPGAWQQLYNRTLGYPHLLEALAANPDRALEPVLLADLRADLPATMHHIIAQLLFARRALLAPAPTADGTLPRDTPHHSLWRRGWLTYQADLHCYHLHGLLHAHREGLIGLFDDAHTIRKQLGAQARAQAEWLDAAEFLAGAGEVLPAVRLLGEHIDEVLAQHQGTVAIDLLKRMLFQLTYGAELAEVQAQLGAFNLAMGAYRDAIDALSTAVELAGAFRDVLPSTEVRRWHRWLAESYLASGQWRRALMHAQTSMGSERTITADVAPCERAALTLLQHRIWLLAGHPDQSRYWLADAQMYVRVNGCPQAAARVKYAEGVEQAQQGKLEQASACLRQALDGLPSGALHGERFAIVAFLARCELALGRVKVAQRLLYDHLPDTYAIVHRSSIVEFAVTLLYSALYEGALDDAWTMFRLAESLLDPTNLRLSAELSLARGWLALHSDDSEGSLPSFMAALNAASEPPLPYIQVAAHISLALAYLQRGDVSTAVVYGTWAARQANSAGLGLQHAFAVLCLAQEAVQRRAWTEVETALAEVRTTPLSFLLDAQYRRVAAELQAARDTFAEAQPMFLSGLEVVRNGPVLFRRWLERRYNILSHKQ